MDNIIEKARSIAANAGQKASALLTYMALQVARQEAAKAPHSIGPGTWSVLTLHRNLGNSKKYPKARPYSHPRREAAVARKLSGDGLKYGDGTGYLGMRPGESARYFKRTGKIEVLAAPGRAL